MFKALSVAAVATAVLAADASVSGSGASSTSGSSGSERTRFKTRQIEINEGINMVKILSRYENKTAGVGSRMTFEIAGTRNSDLRVRSTFSSYNKTSDEKEGTSLRTRFMAIVEYTDADASKSYTNGDGIVSYYRLGLDRGSRNSSTITAPSVGSPGGWKFDPVVRPADPTTGIYKLHVATIDQVFHVDFQFSNAPQTDAAGNIIATPTQTKFSVTINNYPYQGKDTRLALVTRTESKAKGVEEDADDEVKSETVTRQVSFGADAAVAWSNAFNATVNGVVTTNAVLASLPTPLSNVTSPKLKEDDGEDDETDRDDETPALLIFSFDAVQPSKIYWDPTVGTGATIDAEVLPITTNSTAAATTISSFLVIGVIFLATLF